MTRKTMPRARTARKEPREQPTQAEQARDREGAAARDAWRAEVDGSPLALFSDDDWDAIASKFAPVSPAIREARELERAVAAYRRSVERAEIVGELAATLGRGVDPILRARVAQARSHVLPTKKHHVPLAALLARDGAMVVLRRKLRGEDEAAPVPVTEDEIRRWYVALRTLLDACVAAGLSELTPRGPHVEPGTPLARAWVALPFTLASLPAGPLADTFKAWDLAARNRKPRPGKWARLASLIEAAWGVRVPEKTLRI